jgi:hypothetical protein
LAEKRGSPKRAWSSDYWQPSLDSITEEWNNFVKVETLAVDDMQ